MSFKHDFTKGDWDIKVNAYNDFDIVSCKGEKIACLGIQSDVCPKEKESNVRLIRAVPELLQCTEMLHDMLLNEGKNSIAMKAVKMALKKAGIKIEDI